MPVSAIYFNHYTAIFTVKEATQFLINTHNPSRICCYILTQHKRTQSAELKTKPVSFGQFLAPATFYVVFPLVYHRIHIFIFYRAGHWALERCLQPLSPIRLIPICGICTETDVFELPPRSSREELAPQFSYFSVICIKHKILRSMVTRLVQFAVDIGLQPRSPSTLCPDLDPFYLTVFEAAPPDCP